MKKIRAFIQNNWIIILIVLAGFFVRTYKPLTFFMYGHDEDLAGWIIKDILFNHHLRLIGQETSSLGIFIGPYFYYLQIPFYLMTRMDPAGVLALPIILGTFTVFSFYFVFSKIFNKNVGLTASLIYALSPVIIFTDRSPVPTMPVMLWTVWYLYGLWQILKGRQSAYILIGFLFGLIWSLNLSLAILSPLVVLAQIFSKTKISFKKLMAGLVIFTVLMTPFFMFEARHKFQQTKALFTSFTTQKDYVPGTGRGFAKLDRVMQLVDKNTTSIFWDSTPIQLFITFDLLVIIFGFLVYRKMLSGQLALIFFLWQLFNIVFFTFNSINVSEYYLNGMNVIWIGIFSLAFSHLLANKKWRMICFSLAVLFIVLSLRGFFKTPVNKSGYLERKAIVAYIDSDAKAHGYKCVAVSYITSPGNDLGYRYFFWLREMHVNQPKSMSPVYSIVYPLSKVSGVDKTFGALGLVLPDYKRYTKAGVDYSCSGANSNLTDPMFGYSE